MDIVISPLQFKNYVANKILFEINDNYKNKDGKVIELNPSITKEISDLEDKEFNATLNIKIENEDDPNALPFQLEISITGFFEIEEEEDPDCKDSLVQKNSIVILLPYLRSLVTMVTAGANIPPLVLPVLNLNSLFEE